MSARRGAATAAALNGRVYVCGGHERSELRRSVERFDPERGSWELLPPMRERRLAASAAALWCCRAPEASAPETSNRGSLLRQPLRWGTLVDSWDSPERDHDGRLPSPPSMLQTPT